MKKATVIIPEHNEGDQLKDTLQSLYDTSDPELYDVIVVSDGSEVTPAIHGHAVHVHHNVRQGVGAAFDIGVKMASTPYIILMGSDVRFRDNDYLERMIEYLDEEEKSFICTANLAINKDKMDVNAEKITKRYGARICMFMTKDDLPPKGQVMGRLKHEKRVDSYRNILEAKWLKKQQDGIYEIPCILGAFYGVRRTWYDYIKGFQGHRYWGTLEPFVSLKSWLAGGKCQIASDIETAHIFKERPSHRTRDHDLVYNKLIAANILFDEETSFKLVKFLGFNEHLQIASDLITQDMKKISQYQQEFSEIRERDIYWFKEKFGFKDYDQL